MYRIFCFITASLALFLSGNLSRAVAQNRPEIRLVLQITVDGLRADLINRYEAGFGKDGFRYLMKKGTYYTNAPLYQHANTETIVGHTTLATGTFFLSRQGRGRIRNVSCLQPDFKSTG